MNASRIRFTPVELKARHDGWTAARQRHFIQTLANTKSITRACKAVGISRASAYNLRRHAEAAEFRLAWDRALKPGFTAPRSPTPRALQRQRRLGPKRKVDEVKETEGPPISPHLSASYSSALKTLETYLDQLRALDEELGSAQGG